MKIYKNIFNKIISLENLFSAWDKFKSDKQKKRDVQQFEWRLEENIFQLRRDLKYRRYKHGSYASFYLHDPKQRHIHKAIVRDRILHHAVFSVLNPIFEQTFISNSLSCRIDKGTHKGIDILDKTLRQISGNNFKPCFALKCDIKKFFGTVDHSILLSIVHKRIKDADTMRLLEEIVESFSSQYSTIFSKKGLPIGNLTSQLFANIYLNEFDQFVKQKLKIKPYIRYTDDFVIVAEDKLYLENLIESIRSFLSDKLALELHPKKVTIRKFHQGIDFLGYIVLPHHRLLRTETKQRIFKKLAKRIGEYKNGAINKQTLEQSLQSYLGVFSHANAYELSNELKNQFWFWLNE
ncbi:MAG: group II intron reverse transcriptase domain-containing protein [Candidatus Nealsonbacteria bacterium]|nr:group II intron reverse transcriptase domain-containing protein [Candidatus Nealsonbacteria bacterium]